MNQRYENTHIVLIGEKKVGISLGRILYFMPETEKEFDIKDYAKTKPKIQNGLIVGSDVMHKEIIESYRMAGLLPDLDMFFNCMFQIGMCIKYARAKNSRSRYYTEKGLISGAKQFVNDVYTVSREKSIPLSKVAFHCVNTVIDKQWISLFGNVLNAAKFIEIKDKKVTIR